jgi:hypothetical protein
MSKGTGSPIADPASPLVFPRNLNRISGTRYEIRAPDATACQMWAVVGDIVGNVFARHQSNRCDGVQKVRAPGNSGFLTRKPWCIGLSSRSLIYAKEQLEFQP